MNKTNRLQAVFVGVCSIVLLLQLVGCGYSTREVFPEHVQTVAVPIFENRTYEKRVQFDLTEALIKQIELRTPYKVVGPGVGQTMLQGSISEITRQQLNRTENAGLPQEVEVSITVNLQWKDLRTGEIIRERMGMTAVGRHIPARPLSQPFELAQHEAVRRLADDIVATMRTDF